MKVSGVYTTAVVVALATIAIHYTTVRCPECRGRVMGVPGAPHIEVREVRDRPTGRGRTLVCPDKKCKTLLEVIEHG